MSRGINEDTQRAGRLDYAYSLLSCASAKGMVAFNRCRRQEAESWGM